jgi:site-specific DNA-methyltransferase (adenine-specific)
MRLELGDCLEVLKTIPDNSVDSIVTDPPYGLSFMNKKWDYDVPSTDIWIECLRVLKPGGHLLSFSGSRTYHRMAVRIEDAGFDIRDQIMWVYGSGFPKSHNIGKAVDKLLGNEREVVGPGNSGRDMTGGSYGNQSDKEPMTFDITKGTSEWEGWGTALKPSHEPIVMARKPLSEKTVAENVLRWGTGGLNINVSRIGTDDNLNGGAYSKGEYNTDGKVLELGLKRQEGQYEQPQGRWPANIIFECTCDELIDGKEIKGNENYNFNNTNTSSNTFTNRGKYTPRTETPKIHTNPNCPCYILDQQSGISTGKVGMTQQSSPNNIYNGFKSTGDTKVNDGKTDKGGASRFYYCPKASKKDRDEGLDGFENKTGSEITGRKEGSAGLVMEDDKQNPFAGKSSPINKNHHPTVKPTALMLYLIKLVTPVNGTVLDCFLGSGSTGKAAIRGGFDFIGIEREEEYIKIAEARIKNEMNG